MYSNCCLFFRIAGRPNIFYSLALSSFGPLPQVHQSGSGWSPVFVEDNLGVMSVGFLLSSPTDAVIWRGPKKNGLIKQFLRDVDWGELECLLVDTPPGTSDEHLSIVQYLSATGIDGAVVVTTPQEVAIIDFYTDGITLFIHMITKYDARTRDHGDYVCCCRLELGDFLLKGVSFQEISFIRPTLPLIPPSAT